MNKINVLFIGIVVLFLCNCSSPDQKTSVASRLLDSIPTVLSNNNDDIIYSRMKHEASLKFASHQLPTSLNEWEDYRIILLNKISKNTGFSIDHALPLNIYESRSTKREGYTVQNIIFQTQPDVYATANLYIPDGEGPFPGVVVMSGHSINGRLGSSQSLGYTLALNGFVAISVDPWGAGERTTKYREYEYHGANLGASLLNIGKSLMGLQITDNMRAVDVLCSLSYVDSEKIGATGASGGGNQTMWLAAMDERIKASVPVVSVGTFESYIMGSNCICETLPYGLTFTEESGVLALVAPRAMLISNGLKDSNAAFYPSEMVRSYSNAMPVFELYNAEEKLTHLIFDGPHSYPRETREAMLSLFNRHLKDNSKEPPKLFSNTEMLDEDLIINFPNGKRDQKVVTTEEYCKIKGKELRNNYLSQETIDVAEKKESLIDVLKIHEMPTIRKVHTFPTENGWQRFAIETTDRKLIPLLHLAHEQKPHKYTIICSTDGANKVPLSIINEYYNQDVSIAIIDLSGTGEATSKKSLGFDRTAELHTYARAQLWLGNNLTGEWVKELNCAAEFLRANFNADQINFDGTKEAGLAGLYLKATLGVLDKIVLRSSPVSYLFDNREGVDFFSMGIHIPGILEWGDISLVTGIAGGEITFINAVSMSGRNIEGSELEKYETEFEAGLKKCNNRGKIQINLQ